MDNLFSRETADGARLDLEKLERFWDDISEITDSFVILHGGSIVFERYKEDWDAYKTHSIASMAKAVVGGLSLMLAMDDGLIALDDLACRYIPQWRDDHLKSKITVRQLAAHTAGLEDAEDNGIPHEELTGWKGAFWRRENPFIISRDLVPIEFTPGSRYSYSNTGIAMLTYAVTMSMSLAGSPYNDIRQLLWERIICPLGIPGEEWIIGYGETYEAEAGGLSLIGSWGGGSLSTRCLAAIGFLMLNRGVWNGQRLISEKIIDETALTHSGMDYAYGAAWRINFTNFGEKIWKTLPSDAYAALGAGHNALFIIPSRNLVVVRLGARFENANDSDENQENQEDKEDKEDKKDKNKSYADALENSFAIPLGEVFRPWADAPKSDFIREVLWSPASGVLRLATGGKTRDGSDNWPVTWGDDDALYTAYGDGYGFAPQLPSKLGMGFAKIYGTPDDLHTVNIRSDAENMLYGRRGVKASGLLMTDGILYLLGRNSDGDGCGSRLAISADHGAHFEWCDWRFEQFGHMTFVNYGKNYEGARDNYVYMVSHDHPSAYENGDGFVLLRAPKENLMERESYEIFMGMGTDENSGNPVFGSDLSQYGLILKCPSRACRVSISYNAGLKRYILRQQHRFMPWNADTRFDGGFGLYESPEPWGPWKCAYFTERWDIGPGDLGCFPAKWISGDGKTAYHVFSGDDNFCVRKVEFILM